MAAGMSACLVVLSVTAVSERLTLDPTPATWSTAPSVRRVDGVAVGSRHRSPGTSAAFGSAGPARSGECLSRGSFTAMGNQQSTVRLDDQTEYTVTQSPSPLLPGPSSNPAMHDPGMHGAAPLHGSDPRDSGTSDRHGSGAHAGPNPGTSSSSSSSGSPAALHAPTPASRSSRVVVDIRGAPLDPDSGGYAVWVERQPPRRQQRQPGEAAAAEGTSLSGLLQALGGLLITALTIQKLWEEVRWLRSLRQSAGTQGSTPAAGASSSSSSGGGGSRFQRQQQGPDSSGELHGLELPTHLDYLNRLPDQPGSAGPAGPPSPSSNGSRSSSRGRQTSKQRSQDSSSKRGASPSPPSRKGAAAAAAPGGHVSAWGAIAGLQGVKMLLQEVTVLPLLRPDLFGTGIRAPPSGILLYGPPGTGKTMLARAVAGESGATFLPITGSSVLSKWFGQSEANVRRLFQEAQAKAPAVIFIDEVDSLLGRRGGGSGDSGGGPGGASEASRRVTNEFLSYMDGIHTGTTASSSGGNGSEGSSSSRGKVVVIAATNAPWELDEAALSRFAARVLVPLPDAAARCAIMRRALEGVSVEMSDAEWGRVAEQASSYSGRDLMQVCREASMRPVRELWGSRVLEGSDPALIFNQQRQRTVASIAAALNKGASKRQLKKHLDNWHKQHNIQWCTPGELLAAAQQLQRQQQEQEEEQASAQQRQQQQQQQRRCSCSGPSSGPGGEGATPMPAGIGASSKCSCCPGVLDSSRPLDSCLLAPRSHEVEVAAEHGEEEEGLPEAPLQQQEQQQQQQISDQPDGALVGSKATLAAENSSGCTKKSCCCCSSSSSSRPSPAAWTIQDLLSLPLSAIRPVCYADFEAALQQVSGSACDVADKYKEWSEQHGSGAGTTRRDAPWKSLPMYM